MAARTSLKLSVGLDVSQLERDVSAFTKKLNSANLLKIDSSSYTKPLGIISSSASEFQKSLDASNARVLAFGASAGIIYNISKGFQELTSATILVEKELNTINSVLNVSSQNLSKFGNELFNIAKNTGSSFLQVSQAATEFSRQGLGMEETLKRTNDALILSRLSGLDAASSVNALTAAINSFNREALGSSEIVNKLANVDANFAVSSKDLAEAVQRVGSSASDAGASFNELLGLVASVQQTTARGGAVIGNALKTIFTRIERPEVIGQLEDLGITVRDISGQALPAINVLKNLAASFEGFSNAQRSQASELIGGVFQINVLRAALSDLSKEYSIASRATEIAASSTDEANRRNETLNKTLSAQINETVQNFTQLGSKIGQGAFQDKFKSILTVINDGLKDVNEKDSASVGEKIAAGIFQGLTNFISGPGLLVGIGVLGKILGKFASFAKESGANLLGITTISEQQLKIQEATSEILSRNPELIQSILNKSKDRLLVESQIAKTINEQILATERLSVLSEQIATNLTQSGAVNVVKNIPSSRTSSFGHVPTHSYGNIPDELENKEIAGAIAGGYKPGKVILAPKEVGGVMNANETVKYVPGFKQPFINPPENSPAGIKHKDASLKQLGINPYSNTFSRGYVPNFGILGALSSLGGIGGNLLQKQNLPADISEEELKKIFFQYATAIYNPEKGKTPIGLNLFANKAFNSSYVENKGSYIFGQHDGKIFLPTHFAPKSKLSGFSLIKSLKDYDNVAFAVTQDLSPLLQKAGFSSFKEGVPVKFRGGEASKDILVSNAIRTPILASEMLAALATGDAKSYFEQRGGRIDQSDRQFYFGEEGRTHNAINLLNQNKISAEGAIPKNQILRYLKDVYENDPSNFRQKAYEYGFYNAKQGSNSFLKDLFGSKVLIGRIRGEENLSQVLSYEKNSANPLSDFDFVKLANRAGKLSYNSVLPKVGQSLSNDRLPNDLINLAQTRIQRLKSTNKLLSRLNEEFPELLNSPNANPLIKRSFDNDVSPNSAEYILNRILIARGQTASTHPTLTIKRYKKGDLDKINSLLEESYGKDVFIDKDDPKRTSRKLSERVFLKNVFDISPPKEDDLIKRGNYRKVIIDAYRTEQADAKLDKIFNPEAEERYNNAENLKNILIGFYKKKEYFSIYPRGSRYQSVKNAVKDAVTNIAPEDIKDAKLATIFGSRLESVYAAVRRNLIYDQPEDYRRNTAISPQKIFQVFSAYGLSDYIKKFPKNIYRGITGFIKASGEDEGAFNQYGEEPSKIPELQKLIETKRRGRTAILKELIRPSNKDVNYSYLEEEVTPIAAYNIASRELDPELFTKLKSIEKAVSKSFQKSDVIFRGSSTQELAILNRLGKFTSAGVRTDEKETGSYVTSSLLKATGYALSSPTLGRPGAVAIYSKKLLDKFSKSVDSPNANEKSNSKIYSTLDRRALSGILDLEQGRILSLKDYIKQFGDKLDLPEELVDYNSKLNQYSEGRKDFRTPTPRFPQNTNAGILELFRKIDTGIYPNVKNYRGPSSPLGEEEKEKILDFDREALGRYLRHSVESTKPGIIPFGSSNSSFFDLREYSPITRELRKKAENDEFDIRSHESVIYRKTIPVKQLIGQHNLEEFLALPREEKLKRYKAGVTFDLSSLKELVQYSGGNSKEREYSHLSFGGEDGKTFNIGRLFALSLQKSYGNDTISQGFIPNFDDAVLDAVNRERSFGFTPNQVKIGYDNRLNGGVGVYNSSEGTLANAINLHLKEGKSLSDIQTQGSSRGYVPNFADFGGFDLSVLIGSLSLLAYTNKDLVSSFKDLINSAENVKNAENQRLSVIRKDVGEKREVLKGDKDSIISRLNENKGGLDKQLNEILAQSAEREKAIQEKTQAVLDKNFQAANAKAEKATQAFVSSDLFLSDSRSKRGELGAEIGQIKKQASEASEALPAISISKAKTGKYINPENGQFLSDKEGEALAKKYQDLIDSSSGLIKAKSDQIKALLAQEKAAKEQFKQQQLSGFKDFAAKTIAERDLRITDNQKQTDQAAQRIQEAKKQLDDQIQQIENQYANGVRTLAENLKNEKKISSGKIKDASKPIFSLDNENTRNFVKQNGFVIGQTISALSQVGSQFIPERNYKTKAAVEGIGEIANYAGVGSVFGPEGTIIGGAIGALSLAGKVLDSGVNYKLNELAKNLENIKEVTSKANDSISNYITTTEQLQSALTDNKTSPTVINKLQNNLINELGKIPDEYRAKIEAANGSVDKLKQTFDEISVSLKKKLEEASNSNDIANVINSNLSSGFGRLINPSPDVTVFENNREGRAAFDRIKSDLTSSIDFTKANSKNAELFSGVGDNPLKLIAALKQVPGITKDIAEPFERLVYGSGDVQKVSDYLVKTLSNLDDQKNSVKKLEEDIKKRQQAEIDYQITIRDITRDIENITAQLSSSFEIVKGKAVTRTQVGNNQSDLLIKKAQENFKGNIDTFSPFLNDQTKLSFSQQLKEFSDVAEKNTKIRGIEQGAQSDLVDALAKRFLEASNKVTADNEKAGLSFGNIKQQTEILRETNIRDAFAPVLNKALEGLRNNEPINTKELASNLRDSLSSTFKQTKDFSSVLGELEGKFDEIISGAVNNTALVISEFKTQQAISRIQADYQRRSVEIEAKLSSAGGASDFLGAPGKAGFSQNFDKIEGLLVSQYAGGKLGQPNTGRADFQLADFLLKNLNVKTFNEKGEQTTLKNNPGLALLQNSAIQSRAVDLKAQFTEAATLYQIRTGEKLNVPSDKQINEIARSQISSQLKLENMPEDIADLRDSAKVLETLVQQQTDSIYSQNKRAFSEAISDAGLDKVDQDIINSNNNLGSFFEKLAAEQNKLKYESEKRAYDQKVSPLQAAYETAQSSLKLPNLNKFNIDLGEDLSISLNEQTEKALAQLQQKRNLAQKNVEKKQAVLNVDSERLAPAEVTAKNRNELVLAKGELSSISEAYDNLVEFSKSLPQKQRNLIDIGNQLSKLKSEAVVPQLSITPSFNASSISFRQKTGNGAGLESSTERELYTQYAENILNGKLKTGDLKKSNEKTKNDIQSIVNQISELQSNLPGEESQNTVQELNSRLAQLRGQDRAETSAIRLSNVKEKRENLIPQLEGVKTQVVENSLDNNDKAQQNLSLLKEYSDLKARQAQVEFKTQSALQNLVKNDPSIFAEQYAEQVRKTNEAAIRAGKYADIDLKEQVAANYTYGKKEFKRDQTNLVDQSTLDFKNGISSALAEGIKGAKTLREAFNNAFESMLNKITERSIESGVNGLFGFGKSLFTNRNSGGPIGYIAGGLVKGGSGVMDDVPTMMSGGEFVIRKTSVQKYGVDFLNQLNGNQVPQQADGGSFSQILKNEYQYNDAYRPTTGARVADSNLSAIALTDENNPQNKIAENRENVLNQYLVARSQYDREKEAALKAYQAKVNGIFYQGLTSAGIQVAGGVIGSFGEGKSLNQTLGKGSSIVVSKAGYAANYGNGVNSYGGTGDTEFGNLSSTGRAFGGELRRYASGGGVPALLTGGEFIFNDKAEQKYGRDFLNRINSGTLNKYASGGLVGASPAPSSAATTVPGIISSNDNSDQDGPNFDDLIEALNNLTDSLSNQTDIGISQSENGKISGSTATSQVGGATINNNISININNDGSTDSSADSSISGGGDNPKSNGGNSDVQTSQKLSELLKAKVTEVIVENLRPGGILYRLSDKGR